MPVRYRAIFVLLAACVLARQTAGEYMPFSTKQDSSTAASSNAPLQKLQNVGMDQRLGNQIPMDLVFKDEAGNPVKLGQYFDGHRPVVLTLVYYGCPMLCTLVLNDLTRSLNGLNLSA